MKRPDIEGMDALVGAATEGPWAYLKEADFTVEVVPPPDTGIRCVCVTDHCPDAPPEPEQAANADFIAASRSWVPEAIAYIRFLESRVERIHARLVKTETPDA